MAYTEEAVRSAVIGSVRGAAHEFLEFMLWGGDGRYIEAYQREIWTGTFES